MAEYKQCFVIEMLKYVVASEINYTQRVPRTQQGAEGRRSGMDSGSGKMNMRWTRRVY